MLTPCTTPAGKSQPDGSDGPPKLAPDADFDTRFQYLKKMREHNAAVMAQRFLENERKYQKHINALLRQKEQIGNELIKKATERTMAISDMMVCGHCLSVHSLGASI